jgi:drug/metabolite transporter (DMT)-like permease
MRFNKFLLFLLFLFAPGFGMNEILSYLFVSVLWGFTNPFIKRGTIGLDQIQLNHKEWVKYYEIKYLLTRWQYLLPQIINLSGSTVFYYLLGESDISRVVPITNSLTFVMTCLASYLLGEKLQFTDLVGIGLIIAGVLLCIE